MRIQAKDVSSDEENPQISQITRNYLPIDEEWSAYCSRRQKYPQISQISPIFFSNLRTLRNLRMISNGG